MANITRWVTPTKYYAATVQQSLFGPVLMQCWGSRRDDLGGWKETPVESIEQGEKMLQAIYKRRKQHRYVLVG